MLYLWLGAERLTKCLTIYLPTTTNMQKCMHLCWPLITSLSLVACCLATSCSLCRLSSPHRLLPPCQHLSPSCLLPPCCLLPQSRLLLPSCLCLLMLTQFHPHQVAEIALSFETKPNLWAMYLFWPHVHVVALILFLAYLLSMRLRELIICSSHNRSSVHWHHYCDCHKSNHN